ncbi:MAG: hypothetical protein ACK56K_04265 [Akkermansiaceae bacterium]|jgi:long-chain acyl-CoA synthetase|nr:AMP-binding protein [Luteolibacter sp.]
MLVNHWNEIVAKYGEEIAVRGPDSDVSITFREIDQLAEQVDTSGDFVLAIGVSAGFFPALIAAWRAEKPVLLLENHGSVVRPIVGGIPAGTALIKQTCGASGVERSLFFGEAQILAEAERNRVGLGLHRERRGLAAISLAHSYGFGCLALPLLIAGIPLEIVTSPLPFFVKAALDRGGAAFLPGVPAIWKTWFQTGVTAHPVISLAICAGAPLSLELEHGIHSANGLKVKNFYGTSETGAISFDASEAPRSAPGYVGKPLPGIKASRDASGRIVVESDSTAIATDAEAWPAEFGSGAYRTLDQGEVTQAGIFVSRCVGNAINVAGRKVSPTRLVAIFETLDGVLGVKVERSQSRDFERFEEIRVQLTVEKNFDKIAIREQFRQRIESWEMPRHWEFVEG